MIKNKAYMKLEKQKESLEMRKKKLKEAEMEKKIRAIVRSEMTKSKK